MAHPVFQFMGVTPLPPPPESDNDGGHLPTKIKSIEFPPLSLFIWNRKASKDRSIVQ